MRLRIRRLSHALGAEITGIDIREPLDKRSFDEINMAFLEHGISYCSAVSRYREQHIAFSRWFGELDKTDAHRTKYRIRAIRNFVTNRPKPDGEHFPTIISTISTARTNFSGG